jgi:hypothetical protein
MSLGRRRDGVRERRALVGAVRRTREDLVGYATTSAGRER